MKQKDIALILVIVFISGVVSFLVSRTFIAPERKKHEVAVVEPITPEFVQPSEKYFNANSINPTQLIKIQEHQHPRPFGGQN